MAEGSGGIEVWRGRLLAAGVDAARVDGLCDDDGGLTLLRLILAEADDMGAAGVMLDPVPGGVAVSFRMGYAPRRAEDVVGAAEAAVLMQTIRSLAGFEGSTGVAQRTGSPVPLPGLSTSCGIATFPTFAGESVVIRIWGYGMELPAFDLVFRDEDVQAVMRAAVERPFGVVLATGASGSGKSTVAMGLAAEAVKDGRRLVTIEEELHYEIPGAVRGAVSADFTTLDALRSIDSTDLDVGLVAGLDEPEEYKAFFDLASQGHLMVSQVDAPDAPSALHRLIHRAGVPAEQLASSLVAIVATRLIARSCPRCRVVRPATEEERSALGLDPAHRGAAVAENPLGDACRNGHEVTGRLAMAEVLVMTPSLAKVLGRSPDVQEIRTALGPDFRSIDDRIRACALGHDVPVDRAIDGITAHVELTGTLDAVLAKVREDSPVLEPSLLSAGIVTIVFTDVVDSTPINARIGDRAWMEVVRHHAETIRKEVSAWGGVEVKSAGDGFMLAFASGASAVRFGQAVQEAAASTLLPDGEPIVLRVGMHAGEPVQEGNDFFGSSVNVAARVNAAARPGEVLVTDLVYALVSTSGGFTFGEPRAVELKGVDGAYTLYPVL